MPSEAPHMPSETHQSMLNHNANRDMGLQAGEVAFFAMPSKWPRRMIKTAFVVVLLGLAAGVGISK